MLPGAPPLHGIRVLEFAGLAPAPFAGLLLADYGATVIRLDRAVPGSTHTPSPPPSTPDQLARRKSSIAVDLKSPGGIELIKSLLPHVDVVVEPFRPGVLEKLGLGPEEVMMKINPRLIVGRMTGFRRDGKYSMMAGHDINYIGVSGTLSMLGRKGDKPYAPGNILGDFAGGGMICFVGILLALLSRQSTGHGQVVEANMVDGSAILTTMPRLAATTPVWDSERGTNRLDSGCPFYDTYETKDGKHMAVGALEPQFFDALLNGLSIAPDSIPGSRHDKATWSWMRDTFTKTFKSKTRKEWEDIFDGTDACCTPILTHQELKSNGFQQRPAVTLRGTPGYAIADEGEKLEVPEVRGQGCGVEGEGWSDGGLSPGVGGEEILGRWMGWRRGRGYGIQHGGLVRTESARL